MDRIEKGVFLSYRHNNFSWAQAIYKDLRQHEYDVFMDFKGSGSGDFERAILENILARAHFLVLLTPSALERCDDPADLLRREIETALDSKRNIVPLMLEGFDFDTPKIASQLTGKLAALRRYGALRIPYDYFDEAMERLRVRYLNVPLSAVLHPVSDAAQQATTEQRAAANAAPAVEQGELTAQQWFERGFAATDFDEQLHFYTEAIRLKPDYADAFTRRADARLGKGDLEGAIEDLTEAIRFQPEHAEAFSSRGIVRFAKGDWGGAIKDFSAAIRLTPNDAEAFIKRGMARGMQGEDVEGAMKDFTEAIRLAPENAEAFANRGLARGMKKDWEGAIRDFTEAIRLQPDYAYAYSVRGGARYMRGDWEGALKDYNEAIRLNPDYADSFTGRSFVRRARGDNKGANEDVMQAERLKAAARADPAAAQLRQLFHWP